MSLLGTILLARAGDLMFAPAVTGLKVVGAQAVKVGLAAGMGWAGYKAWETTRYKTTYSMFLDRHWEDFGLVHETNFGKDRIKRSRPKYIDEQKVSEYLYKSYFKLPKGMAISHVLEKLPAIELALNAEIDCYREGPHCVMEISTGHLRYNYEFDMNQVLNVLALPKKEGGGKYILPLVVGHSKRGFQIIDLADYKHFLIGGQTGGGKSVFMRGALTGLLHYLPPSQLHLYAVDLKGGLEFKLFADAPHVKGIAKDQWETLELLVGIEQEMENRMTLLYEAGPTIENIEAYNEIAEEKLPYMVLAIDEFAELSPEDVSKKATTIVPSEYRQLAIDLQLFDIDRVKKGTEPTALEKELLEKVHAITSRLLRLARAVGIHLIIATQRPDAKVLPGQSKQNIPSTVAFKVRNKVNSQILLDSDSAAVKIPPGIPGRAIFQIGHLETEIQVPYLSTKKARQLLEELEEKLLTHTVEDFQSPSLNIPDEFYDAESDPFDFMEPDFLPYKEETKEIEYGL